MSKLSASSRVANDNNMIKDFGNRPTNPDRLGWDAWRDSAPVADSDKA